MRSTFLNFCYRAEVFFSRLQGIASNNPVYNGEYQLLKKLSGRLTQVIDAGCNLGDWTSMVLKYNSYLKRVTCIEPLPANFEALTKKYQSDRRVYLLNCLLSAERGTASLVGNNEIGNGSSFLSKDLKQGFMKLNTRTLDDIWEENNCCEIDLIKLDIEGEEISALLGAQKLFKSKGVALVQLEYNSTWLRNKRSMKELFDLARQYQYRLLLENPFGVSEYPKYGEGLDDFRMRNFVLVREDYIRFLNPIPPSGRAFVEMLG